MANTARNLLQRQLAEVGQTEASNKIRELREVTRTSSPHLFAGQGPLVASATCF